MSTASQVTAPNIGLGDDVQVYSHSYVGRSIITDDEPLVSITLYGSATGELVDLAHVVATPAAAERLRDSLTAALEEFAQAAPAVTS